jgi:capsular exopolysaccharide synthesis family protein
MSRIYRALKQFDESDRVVQLVGDLQPKVAETPAPPASEPSHAKTRVAPAELSPVEYRVVATRIPARAPIFPFDGSDERAAEEYRVLRTNLLHNSSQLKVIVVTSATSGDGKTVTALNLAGALALRSDLRVAVIDADLRRSAVADTLGIEGSPGLAEVLGSGCALNDALVRISQIPNLCVLPGGNVLFNPTELIDSAICGDVFSELRERFDYVIVDTTPISVVADFKLLHRISDGALVVARPGHTDRRALKKALSEEMKDKFLGVVINSCEDWLFWKAHGDYSYYSGEYKRKSARR